MNAKHINIELMQYAMELCDKEEKKKIKKEKEFMKKTRALESTIFSTRDNVVFNLLMFGLFTVVALYLY